MNLSPSQASLLKLGLKKAVIMAITTVVVGYLYAWVAPRAFPPAPAGFGFGMLHGAMMPIALPSLVVGKDVPIYATLNTGRFYKIGYIAGINICGLIFFGPLFYRPSAKKEKVTSTSS